MVDDSPKRGYDNTLREQQAEATRERILDAMAQQLAADGFAEFSIVRVAKRAGVSEPTIYRHFGSREGLFAAFSTWFERRGGHPGLPRHPDDLLGPHLDAVFTYFETQDLYIRASQTTALAQVIAPGRENRRRRLAEVYGSMTEHLEPEFARQICAVLGYVLGSRTYLAMKDEYGLDPSEAAAAIRWALGAISRAIPPRPDSSDPE